MKDLAGKVRYIGEGDEGNILVRFDPRTNESSPTQLFRQLEAMIADFKPDLVTLDPAAELYEGNENDRAQVRQFVSTLRRMGRRYQCAILLSLHPSLQGLSSGSGTSGSTAWNNSARVRSYLTTPKEESIGSPLRELTTMKANYGLAGGITTLHWQAGAYIVDQPLLTPNTSNVVDRIQIDSLALDALRELVGRDSRVPLDPRAPTGFANAARQLPKCKHLNQAVLVGALDRLLASGKAIKLEMGPQSRRRVYVRPADMRYPGEVKNT
jgi:RecA-family ATPase